MPLLTIAALLGPLWGQSAAWAWDFAPLEPLALDGAPLGLEPAELAGGLGLVAWDGERVWLLHPQTGDVLGSAASDAGAVSAAVYGDGPRVLLCGPGGLDEVQPTGSGLSTPVALDPAPCLGVLAADEGLVAGQDGVWRIPWGGEGWGEPADTGLELPGVPLFAVAGRTLAVVGLGEALLAWVDLDSGEAGLEALPAEAGGLAAVDGVLALSLPGLDQVLLDGAAVDTLPGPGPLWAGDFDGDGALELLVLHPLDGSLGVLDPAEGAEQALEGVTGVLALAVGDVNADGCDDLLYTDGDGAALTVALGCLTTDALDQDGDGQSPEGGDCDDRDGTVGAGFEELCDGLDNNCDGQTDEIPDTLALDGLGGLPESVLEDEVVQIRPEVVSCDTEATVVWSWEGPAECEEAGVGLHCWALDQGTVTVYAALVGGAGATLAEASLDVDIGNVAPIWLDWPPDGVMLDRGEELLRELVALDVAADTVTLTLVDAPPEMRLVDGRFLSFRSMVTGPYTYTLRAEDEDGGSSELTLSVEVVPRETDLSCGALAVLLLGGLAGWLFGRGSGMVG